MTTASAPTIRPITADDPEARSADVVAENVAQLRALFPEAFTEGRVDFPVLRQLLDGAVDDGPEKYGLTWHGKRQARQLALTPSTGTLLPRPEESVDWDTTQNLVIEGDNLEVLKLLQKSYAGKVKLIYIDPPYNTGKDFVYPDDYRDSMRNYLAVTGQVDGEGRRLGSNAEASGRFHTDWLNMMYPRLKLARNLMQDDGAIFVSVDQGEIANLRLVLDEVFGEENLVNVLSWIRTRTPAALSQKTKTVVEYLLCYERSRSAQPLLGVAKPAQSANTLLNQPNPVGTLTLPVGTDTGIADGVIVPGAYGSESYAVDLLDETEVRDGRFVRPVRLRARFRWSQPYLDEQLAAGTRVRVATAKLLPSYEKDSYGREAIPNLIDETVGVGTNESAGAEVETMMGGKVFDYPKPVSLLRYLVNSCTVDGDIVLDFFAGSGTTAHAVFAQNAADGGKRRSISVQLDAALESPVVLTGGTRFTKLSELTAERIRRAGRKVRDENPMFTGDVGFRVFKLESSNIRAWSPTPDDLAGTLLDNTNHLIPGRTEQDVLFELLLKLGLELTVPIETVTIAGKVVHAVGGGTLLACLTESIIRVDAEPLALGIVALRDRLALSGRTDVVFRDSAFADDVAKTNLAAILEQHGLTNVRSL